MNIPKTFIHEKDTVWHNMDEMPTTTTNVTFKMNDNKEIIGEIVVEMSGFYFYKREKPENWMSEDDIKEWKFR